jgi:putative endonuclease
MAELVEANGIQYLISMPYVYILECGDGSFYTGSTWNLEKRIGDHMSGDGAKYTKNRQPIRLIYMEEYSRIDEAYAREKQIQGWSRKKKIALIEGQTDKLPLLSKNRESK